MPQFPGGYPNVATPAVGDKFLVDQAGTTKAETLQQVATAILGGTTTGTVATSVAGTGTPAAGKYVDGAAGAWTALPAAGANTALSNLASVAINLPLTTGAGTVAAITATAPAATAASQVGVGATITASAAVDGSSSHAAARGGDLTLQTGAAVNSGAQGQVLVPNNDIVLGPQSSSGVVLRGNNGCLELRRPDALTNWASFYASSIRAAAANSGANEEIYVNPNGSYIGIYSTTATLPSIRFSNTANAENGLDSGIARVAASVIRATDGTDAGIGWLQTAGSSRVASDITNATATMATITGLSSTLIAGRSYLIRLVIKAVNSTAADGIKFDFNAGTATMTDFWVGGSIQVSGGTDVVGTGISTALGTAISFTTFTGESVVVIEGFMTCNAGGTFIPRFAEASHSTGTATVRRGTNMYLIDYP